MEKQNRAKIFFIGIGLVLVMLAIADFYAKRGLFGEYSPKRQIQKMTLRDEIHRASEQYLDRNRQLMTELEKNIAQAGKEHFAQAEKNIPEVTELFSGISWNGKLCYKMAKDRLCSSSDTRTALNEVLEPRIIRHCENGNLAVRNELDTFLLRLAENRNQYHAELALITGQSSFFEGKDEARKQFLIECSRLSEKLKTDALKRSLTIASAGLELIFIRSTIQMASRVCGHIVARLAASGTTAGICAVADGPLPIGDAVGAVLCVGSLAWCAYDLYDISMVMPGEVRRSLEKTVADYQANCRKQALDFAQIAVAEYQSAADDMIKNL